MLGRLAFFLLLATLGLGAAALAFDWRVTLPPELADAIGWRAGMSEEGVVEADTRWYLNDAKAMQLIADAVAREDSGDAALFLDIARKLNIPLAGGLEAAALALEAREDSLETQFADYLAGFVSGEGETLAGLGGAITSDLTVYGDIRDIVVEGGKMIAGEDYSPPGSRALPGRRSPRRPSSGRGGGSPPPIRSVRGRRWRPTPAP